VGAKHTKNLKQICANDPSQEHLGSYSSIDGGISVKKPIKYCDFTGFHTTYQDPKTGLRYFNNDFYPYVKEIPEGVKNEVLSIRKANVVLK
jgi:INO80 complex subunit C